MTPVFRHGRLRLYLLRLLDEEPRHGYEVIRLLRDRFMGVYAPSPGTIYPRLSRLEDEGLVTHDEENGRKVYRITEAGREELRSRGDELDELEEELSESVSDIAREFGEDVRATVRSLREELTRAAREVRQNERDTAETGPDDRLERHLHAQFVQNPKRRSHCRPRLRCRLAGCYPVIGIPRKLISLAPHLLIERRQKYVAEQGRNHPALRSPALRWKQPPFAITPSLEHRLYQT